MVIERQIGEGPESVYAYYFPSMVREGSFPHKIGRTRRDPVARVRDQQASMLEEPIIGTLVKCENCFAVESMLHIALADRRLASTFGSEWFDIHPNAIENVIKDGPVWLPWFLQLRHHRVTQGLSQTNLGNAAGLRQETISLAENGHNISMKTFIAICEELKVRVNLEWVG
jgi:DNA-binding XRE family transcriptional regulator